jgi:hypothetical protein
MAMTPPDLTALVTTLKGGYLDWTRYFPAFLQLRPWFFPLPGQVRFYNR